MLQYQINDVENKVKNYTQTGVKKLYFLDPRVLNSFTFDNANDIENIALNSDGFLYVVDCNNSISSVSISDNVIKLDYDFEGVQAKITNQLKKYDKLTHLVVFAHLNNDSVLVSGITINKTLPFSRYKYAFKQQQKEVVSGLLNDSTKEPVNKHKRQLTFSNKDLLFFTGNIFLFEILKSGVYKGGWSRATAGDITITTRNLSYVNLNGTLEAVTSEYTDELVSVAEHSYIYGDLTGLVINNASLTALDISQFLSLSLLQCYNNDIITLDVSNLTALTQLRCYNNNIVTLNTTNLTALTELSCYNNDIITLDVSNLTALTDLQCYSNDIIVLDVTNLTSLTNLLCLNNDIVVLNVTNLTSLVTLSCYNNDIIVLDVTNLTALTALVCFGNSIVTLDVSNLVNLTLLSCNSNSIVTLDVPNLVNLTRLICWGNSIATLDVSTLIKLTELSCSSNLITTLDVSNCIVLSNLNCSYNNLSTTELNSILQDLDTNAVINGTLNISNNTGTHTDTTSYNNLISKGWTITT